MGHTRAIDLNVTALYFTAMASPGRHFRRRTDKTEQHVIGGCAYPGWLPDVEWQFASTPQQSGPGKARRDEVVRAVKPRNRERTLLALGCGETSPG